MLRALSTRRSHMRYEKLGEEPAIGLLDQATLTRSGSTTLPARTTLFDSPSFSRKSTRQTTISAGFEPKPAKKSAKSHPLLSLFDGRRKKKTTARPELARYLEYVKEGGLWDAKSNVPVIYYK